MDRIAILDYGSQLTHLLATEVRRLGVYSEILEPEVQASELAKYKGIILSGGPNSVYDQGAPQIDPEILELDVPILGICYGHQLIVHALGGQVEPGTTKEYGKAMLRIDEPVGILKSFQKNEETQVWMSHGDTVTSLPESFSGIGSTKDCQYCILGNQERNIYSIQFHLEVVHTERGREILQNFLDLCDVSYDWNIENFLDDKLAEIRQQVGDKKVFLLVSGGVDSTVAFALLDKAIGHKKVYGMFVDTGFMRHGEVEQVTKALQSIGVKNLRVYDGSSKYFEALKGVYEPEAKRKIIGDLFLDIQKEVSDELSLNPEEWLLGQGTIYPDTIESGGTKHADKIKTHHNRVPQIEELIKQGRIIEPIADLYKDEVRQLGEALNLPHHLVHRHPFPGPGLAVRTLCVDEAEQINPADEQAISTELPNDLQAKILPIKSVGVQGDGRTYRHPLAISGKFPGYRHALELSTDLTNRHSAINRVLWQISPDSLDSAATLTKKFPTPDRIEILQKADYIFTKLLKESGHYEKIWQAPVVLIPVQINDKGQESIVLRPISSREAMTADVYPIEIELLHEYANTLKEQNLPISGVFFDLTHKPPGTIEWE